MIPRFELTFVMPDGKQRKLFLHGWRATLMHRIAARAPTQYGWVRGIITVMCIALRAKYWDPRPPEYTDEDETWAYYCGYEDGWQNKDAWDTTDHMNAYSRGFWDGYGDKHD